MEQLSEFGKIFMYMIIGGSLVSLTLFLNSLLAPKHPTSLKLDSYECGESPRGNSWVQFNPRFYVVALIFLLFDVEMVFLFPWATIFGQKALIEANQTWGWITFYEMLAFVGVLILGLVYIWKKGDLEWVKPKPTMVNFSSNVPATLYEVINKKQHKTVPFTMESEATKPPILPQTTGSKPAFKPSFRKTI